MHLETAKRHFSEDIRRTQALELHARHRAAELKSDILRSSWMFAVGATDAYFSDAYGDLIARTLRAADIEPKVEIPDRLSNLKIPVVAVIRQAGGGWRWRMAARELIVDENVLSLDKIRMLFGQFFPKSRRLMKQKTIEPWILHADAKVRCLGITPAQYNAMTDSQKAKAREDALEIFENRMADIFQRRHDCIHNCDRPKVALQSIAPAQVQKIIEDLCFLVDRSHDALFTEFPKYLKRLGFNPVSINRVLA